MRYLTFALAKGRLAKKTLADGKTVLTTIKEEDIEKLFK